MAEFKTKKNNASVAAYLNAVEDEQKRKDSKAIAKMMREVTGKPPKMWGASIVGFDTCHYKYASGREGDWPIVGFAPRKQDLTLYIMDGAASHARLLKKLGKHKIGKSCLYIEKLEDVDMGVLRELVAESVERKRKGSG